MFSLNDSSRCAAALALALAVSACASSGQRGDGGVDRAVSRTQEGFDDAALTPLNDLNLRRVPIPPKLEAIRSPYEPVANMGCIALGAEVDSLTAILGADVDAPPSQTRADQQVGDAAGDLALNQVQDAVTGFIPYRSVIRYATGATAHERRLRAAYERGVQRRAYLKGIGSAMGCGPPAAPDPRAMLPPERAPIEYRNNPHPGD
jgi:hypothetical protein